MNRKEGISLLKKKLQEADEEKQELEFYITWLKGKIILEENNIGELK